MSILQSFDMTLDFSVYIGIGQKLRKHTIKINMYLQPLISFYGYVWYTARNICSKGGEKCSFPSFLGRVWSLKLGSTLLCDLSRASFWRPWWKEAPTSRSNPATSSQNLQGKTPSGVSGKTVIWERVWAEQRGRQTARLWPGDYKTTSSSSVHLLSSV